VNATELINEIERVKAAIAKTKSPYLRRDYEKHLKKLERDWRKNYRQKKSYKRICSVCGKTTYFVGGGDYPKKTREGLFICGGR